MLAKVDINSETSRIRSALVNTGTIESFAEAEQRLAASRLSIVLGDEASRSLAGQTAFLTAVVTATRCFGKVTVTGPTESSLIFPFPPAKGALTIGQAATALGASSGEVDSLARAVRIGASGDSVSPQRSVQAWWHGWMAGVVPGHSPESVGRGDCALAGVAAGALAVGQAFLAEQGDPHACRLAYRMSLWDPSRADLGGLDPGPEQCDCYLPLELWFIGLGNLGQAYLWSLSTLPYPEPDRVLLFFQDDETVGSENWGTSVLVQRGRYGEPKTKIAEEWACARGFRARRIDRRLDQSLLRTDREPAIALAGLDRMRARRLLGAPGFEYIIDAGLGATARDYSKWRINVFDRMRDPGAHFAGVDDESAPIAELLQQAAYQQLRAHDPCGAATLAESSVAVPFVSAFAGAAAIAQTVRVASGEAHHSSVVGDVADVRNVRATLGNASPRLSIPVARARS